MMYAKALLLLAWSGFTCPMIIDRVNERIFLAVFFSPWWYIFCFLMINCKTTTTRLPAHGPPGTSTHGLVAPSSRP